MIYQRPDGTSIALVAHTPDVWAQVRYDQLRALGCSQKYAAKIAAQYAELDESEEEPRWRVGS